jgi:hypothetical protein
VLAGSGIAAASASNGTGELSRVTGCLLTTKMLASRRGRPGKTPALRRQRQVRNKGQAKAKAKAKAKAEAHRKRKPDER